MPGGRRAMKKVLCLVLTLAMILAMSVTAFAEEEMVAHNIAEKKLKMLQSIIMERNYL